MPTTTAVSTLNELITTCRDGENGFRTAASAVTDNHVKAMFVRFSRQRAEMARELQEQVRRLGADPEKMGTPSAALHRGWMNIKALVGASDDHAIVVEAERGEDVAKSAYEKALTQELPAGARELVEQQAAIVFTARDEVRALEKHHA